MKRTISFLLVLVMLLGILPMAAFAEDTETTLPQVTLTADKTTVKAGKEITLTLGLDKDVSTVMGNWQWDFVWDSTYFDFKTYKIGTSATAVAEGDMFAIKPLINPKSHNNYAAPYTGTSVTAGNAIKMHYLKQGTIAELTLTAKQEITQDTDAKFFVYYSSAIDSDGNGVTVTQVDPDVDWGTNTQMPPADGVGLSVTVVPEPKPIDITVYYADNGTIVTGKDGTLLNYAPVTVTDVNDDGKLTMYDGFACFHDTYHTAGSTGYADSDSGWVTKFWSVDSPSVSYGRNNVWVSGTAEEIEDGDSLCLYTCQDQVNWSDLFTYFDSLTGTATANEETSFHVNGYSFFGSSSTTDATAAPVGATVTATCGDKTLTTTTDDKGEFTLTFPTAGEWTVLVNGTCSYTCDAGYYAGQTYTNAPVAPAQMTVTVSDGEGQPDPTPDPDPEPDPEPTPTTNGYTVTLDEKKEVTMDEIVSIDVKVGHTDETVTTYNAFDMTFSYDSDVLDLTSTEIEGLTVTTGEGTVRVQGYGPDREIDSTAFTLTFRAKKTGETAVNVTSPKVDAANHAIGADAPEAVKTVGTTNVTIGGYPVSLPEDFAGATVVEPGTDYTFTANNKNYNYTFEGTTMGGEKVDVIDNDDGTFTIKSVSGKINVVSEKTPKSFKVTLGTDMTGADTAQYMTAYEATLTEDKNHYTYTVSVTIGGVAYTGYGVSGDKYTIPGKDITGDIVFTVTKTPIQGTFFKVKFEGNGTGDAQYTATSVAPNASYSFTLNKETGYKYDVTAKMGNSDASFSEDNGTYTFAQVTGDLVITITKTLDVTVTVYNFVELDGKTVFLVEANATLGTGKALTYDGAAMFWSESTEEGHTGYNAWCYLVIVDKEESFTAADATAKIDAATMEFTTLAGTKDVNESGVVDINDAQLVYDIYNGKYEDFTTVTMRKFLNADVNADGIVNVTDAAAVVAAIQ